MRKIFSMMLLCAAVVLASCSKDDSTTIDVTGVTLDKTTASIVIGTTQTLVATVAPDNVEDKNVTWTSSDATVATVANGVVTAVKEGTTTITATSVADPTKKATCAVTVTKIVVAVTGVTLNKTTLPLVVGSKETLTATVAPADATNKDVTWSTSDATIATVSTTGEISAIKDGTATITVASVGDNTKTATCVVTVTKDLSITWAVGNLVAKTDGSGCEVGTATDGGLFFQFGSLVGWSATSSSPTIAVKPANLLPANETWAATGKIWQGTTGTVPFTVKDSGTDNEKAGVGDPCRYYLGGTWRLPTKDEYKTLFNNTTTNWAGATDWSWNNDSKSAKHTDGLTFPASGDRNVALGGSLSGVGASGAYWSASPYGSSGCCMTFYISGMKPSNSSNRVSAYPVRCVQASN